MTARELVNRISLLDMVKQLGDRLTVGQRTLTPPVLVRIQVPQPLAIHVVVEGFKELKLDATQVPGLSDPRVDQLRLFRNGCFHYQRDYKKFAPFLSGDLEAFRWAEELHQQFGAFFLKHRAERKC